MSYLGSFYRFILIFLALSSLSVSPANAERVDVSFTSTRDQFHPYWAVPITSGQKLFSFQMEVPFSPLGPSINDPDLKSIIGNDNGYPLGEILDFTLLGTERCYFGPPPCDLTLNPRDWPPSYNFELVDDIGSPPTYLPDGHFDRGFGYIDRINLREPGSPNPEQTIFHIQHLSFFALTPCPYPGAPDDSCFPVDEVFIDSNRVAGYLTYVINPVPVPAAIWLFGTGILGLIGFSKRKKSA
jgi:hypothetical protein